MNRGHFRSLPKEWIDHEVLTFKHRAVNWVKQKKYKQSIWYKWKEKSFTKLSNQITLLLFGWCNNIKYTAHISVFLTFCD